MTLFLTFSMTVNSSHLVIPRPARSAITPDHSISVIVMGKVTSEEMMNGRFHYFHMNYN